MYFSVKIVSLFSVLEEKQHMSDNNHFFRTRIEELANNQTQVKLNMSVVQKQLASLSSQVCKGLNNDFLQSLRKPLRSKIDGYVMF